MPTNVFTLLAAAAVGFLSFPVAVLMFIQLVSVFNRVLSGGSEPPEGEE